jgi:hypothetical protein
MSQESSGGSPADSTEQQSAPPEPQPAAASASTELAVRPPVRLEIESQTGRIVVTTASPEAVAAAPPPPMEEGIFGIGDSSGGPAQPSPLDEIRDKLTASLGEFANQLSDALKTLVADLNTLEVATYVSSDVSSVTFVDGPEKLHGDGIQQRALTRITLDGDSVVVLPTTGGALDDRIWNVHLAMVERAQTNRTEMLKAAASAVAGLVGNLKVP